VDLSLHNGIEHDASLTSMFASDFLLLHSDCLPI
jgi:hypothetical protein